MTKKIYPTPQNKYLRVYYLITFFYYLPPPPLPLYPPQFLQSKPTNNQFKLLGENTPPPSQPTLHIHAHPCSSMLIHPLMIPFHTFHPFHPFLPGSPLACSKYNLFLTSKAQKIFCFVYDRKSRHLITARFGELMISSLLSLSLAYVQGGWTVVG